LLKADRNKWVLSYLQNESKVWDEQMEEVIPDHWCCNVEQAGYARQVNARNMKTGGKG